MPKTPRRRALRLGVAIPLLVCAALAPGQPSAAADPETASRAVTYRDLDLNRPDGVAKLRWRVAIAARRICDRGDHTSLAVRAAYAACVAAARSGARPQMVAAVGEARLRADLSAEAPHRLAAER